MERYLCMLRMIVTERDYSRTEFLRAVSFLLRAPCSASSLQHLTNDFHILPILRPPRRFLGAHDVFKSRGKDRVTVHLEPYGVRRQVGESGRPRGIEREIQAP